MTYATGPWGTQAKKRSSNRKEYFSNYKRDWYLKNKERVIRKAKEYYEFNKDSVKIRVSGYGIKWRKELLDEMGSKCIKCGFDDPRALQIDHINGRGRKERREVGPSFWRKVGNSYRNNEGIYQLLCANCNFIKRYENDELRVEKGGEM